MKTFFSFLLLCLSLHLLAQQGKITGTIVNETNNQPLPFVSIGIQGTGLGSLSGEDGTYTIENLQPGVYTLQISAVGFKPSTIFDVEVFNNKSTPLNITLQEENVQLNEVEVKANPFVRNRESPVSVKTINANEIERFPGGNRDISRVIQSLPGVSTGVSFRNDIIVRGGSPNENRFYIDDIEIPTINHFSTQGASGGSNGYINVDFVKNVEFFTGAYPSNRGNTLSSVMDFTFKEGRSDRVASRITIGALEAGLSLEGPLSAKKNATFIASYRRSYQQLLFKAFELPFLPTYNDAQFKIKAKLKEKNELVILGMGAFDNFDLNLKANKTKDQQFLLGYLPYINQWNYTLGTRYKRFLENGNILLVASRTQISNGYKKYQGNQNEDASKLVFKLNSNESENKLRLEHNIYRKNWKINYGGNYEFAQYQYTSNQTIAVNATAVPYTFENELDLHKGGLFTQLSNSFFKDRLSVSLGLRTDFNSFNSSMANPLNQLSPRLSVSVAVLPGWNISFNTGRYYQLPPNTTLGYTDTVGVLVNKSTLTYIANTQFVVGTDYSFQSNTRVSIEGFIKLYDNYPFLLDEQVSLANLGATYGIIGDAPADNRSTGRAYGLEVSVQQKLFKGFFGILAYTLAYSEFTDANGMYVPSSWDRRHVFSATLGKKFKRNWDISSRFGLASGAPYTPYDVARSVQIAEWDSRNDGIFDYGQLNTLRNGISYQWDLRVDKRWSFKRWSLNLYLDIRNVLNSKTALAPTLSVIRDSNGTPVEDPNNPGSYQPDFIPNEDGILQPSLGIVIEL